MKRKNQEEYDSPLEVAWRADYMKRRHTYYLSDDPVVRMVCSMTSQETLDWLRFRGTITAEEHAVDGNGFNTLEANLREQYKWHRLQGRLDRFPFLAALAELWKLRQSVKVLEAPAYKKENDER